MVSTGVLEAWIGFIFGTEMMLACGYAGETGVSEADQPPHVRRLGVLPPISKLNPDQVMYHFISSYTAKVAGTVEGMKEPVATFSACFGDPFLVWHPYVHVRVLDAGAQVRLQACCFEHHCASAVDETRPDPQGNAEASEREVLVKARPRH